MPKTQTILLETTDEVRFFAAAVPGQDVLAIPSSRMFRIVMYEPPYLTLEELPIVRKGKDCTMPLETHRRLVKHWKTHAGVLNMTE